jgi:protein TonB
VLGGIIGGAPGSNLPPPPKEAPKRIRVGGNVQSAKMIRQVQPIYPQIAKSAHVQGTVILHAVISKGGNVEELAYVSGPPLLMRAAMDAVRQWRYQPTLLNGEPVEVDTTISVIFTLGGG